MIVALTFLIYSKMTGINTCSHSITAVALSKNLQEHVCNLSSQICDYVLINVTRP